jgi:hypothetical protein
VSAFFVAVFGIMKNITKFAHWMQTFSYKGSFFVIKQLFENAWPNKTEKSNQIQIHL